MALNIPEPYSSWLKSKLNVNVDENTRFTLTVTATTKDGPQDLKVEFDVAWFTLLYVNDAEILKLPAVLALLNNPEVLTKFKVTLENPAVKRLIAEFLLFHEPYLNVLKDFIDFTKLNVPINFISHALFIRRSEGEDTPEISRERLKIVSEVLDTGFVLPPESPAHTEGAVVRKIVIMQGVENKLKVAHHLLKAGFPLFSNNVVNDTEVALILIESRADPDCLQILKEHKQEIQNVQIQAEGSEEQSSVANYYYWVKEDIAAVQFLKDELGINYTSS